MRCRHRSERPEWLNTLDDEPVPAGLRERVSADARAAAAHASASPLPRAGRTRMMRRAVLVTVFLVALVAGGYRFFTGRQMDAALAQVADAMQKVKSAHFVGWYSPAGQMQKPVESWVKGGNRFRTQAEGLVDIGDDGERSVVVVTVYGVTTAVIRSSGEIPGLPGGFNYLDLFTGAEGLQAALKTAGAHLVGWREGVLPDGRKADIAEFEIGTGKTSLYIDPTSRLLIGQESYDGEGRLVQKLEKAEYDIEIADAVLTVPIPADAIVSDVRGPATAEAAERHRALVEKLRASANQMGVCNIQDGDAGSQFHDDLRFRYLGREGLDVFYLTDRNAYFVVGKALVYERGGSFRQVVEDAEVAAPGPPDHSPEEVRAKLAVPRMPADLWAKREARAQEIVAAGGQMVGRFGDGGHCSGVHDGLEFVCRGEYIWVYYFADRNVYSILGTAEVRGATGPGSVEEVTDREIAAPGPPNPEALENLKPHGRPTPSDVKAAREAKAWELEAAGWDYLGRCSGSMTNARHSVTVTFESRDPYDYGFELLYRSDRNVYYIIGKALVRNFDGAGSARVVQDAEIPGPPRR